MLPERLLHTKDKMSSLEVAFVIPGTQAQAPPGLHRQFLRRDSKHGG